MLSLSESESWPFSFGFHSCLLLQFTVYVSTELGDTDNASLAVTQSSGAAPAVEILAPGGPQGMRQLAYPAVPSLELRIESLVSLPDTSCLPSAHQQAPTLTATTASTLSSPSPSSTLPSLSAPVALAWKQLAGPTIPFSSPAIAPTASSSTLVLPPGTLKPGATYILALTASRHTGGVLAPGGGNQAAGLGRAAVGGTPGASAVDYVTVRVGASPLVVRIPGGSRTVNTGEKVVLDAVVVDPDEQGKGTGNSKKGYKFQYLWSCARLSPAAYPIPISTDTNVSALLDDLNSNTNANTNTNTGSQTSPFDASATDCFPGTNSDRLLLENNAPSLTLAPFALLPNFAYLFTLRVSRGPLTLHGQPVPGRKNVPASVVITALDAPVPSIQILQTAPTQSAPGTPGANPPALGLPLDVSAPIELQCVTPGVPYAYSWSATVAEQQVTLGGECEEEVAELCITVVHCTVVYSSLVLPYCTVLYCSVLYCTVSLSAVPGQYSILGSCHVLGASLRDNLRCSSYCLPFYAFAVSNQPLYIPPNALALARTYTFTCSLYADTVSLYGEAPNPNPTTPSTSAAPGTASAVGAPAQLLAQASLRLTGSQAPWGGRLLVTPDPDDATGGYQFVVEAPDWRTETDSLPLSYVFSVLSSESLNSNLNSNLKSSVRDSGLSSSGRSGGVSRLFTGTPASEGTGWRVVDPDVDPLTPLTAATGAPSVSLLLPRGAVTVAVTITNAAGASTSVALSSQVTVPHPDAPPPSLSPPSLVLGQEAPDTEGTPGVYRGASDSPSGNMSSSAWLARVVYPAAATQDVAQTLQAINLWSSLYATAPDNGEAHACLVLCRGTCFCIQSLKRQGNGSPAF